MYANHGVPISMAKTWRKYAIGEVVRRVLHAWVSTCIAHAIITCCKQSSYNKVRQIACHVQQKSFWSHCLIQIMVILLHIGVPTDITTSTTIFSSCPPGSSYSGPGVPEFTCGQGCKIEQHNDFCSKCICTSTAAIVATKPVCQNWCDSNSRKWRVKCTWSRLCDGCSACSGEWRLYAVHRLDFRK